ncbi:MAG TPA: 50S ribosomal protein L4 [Bryobacteraceae bacterium]|nr:50S ribosomal protein L4 [Bryobacteraceae bacterium]
MPTVDLFDLSNQVVGSLELSDEVFGAEVNDNLIYEAVRWHRASIRSGSAKTKRRWEVAGSGKKLWKQKGTGRARMGSIRSPLWRHGGTTHGPEPRSYAYKLPRKMQLGALRSALSAKLRDGELKVVREFDVPDHKTKTLAAALLKLEANRKVLIVDIPAPAGTDGRAPEFELERRLALGTRNIEGVKAVPTRDVTVYDLLNHRKVVLTEAAARKLSEALAK